MRPVTILATRSQGIAPRNCFPMKRLLVQLLLRRMACAAINAGKLFIMRKVLLQEIGMAGCAVQRRVDGSSELILINKYGDGLPIAFAGQCLIAMTGETVAVFLCEGRPGSENGNYNDKIVPPISWYSVHDSVTQRLQPPASELPCPTPTPLVHFV